MVQNSIIFLRIYELANRETINAIGGVWHEIINVPECIIKDFLFTFNKKFLDLKKAELYKVKDGRSYFAVLKDIRYGIPDLATKDRIWPSTAHKEMTEEQLDDISIPGRDLRSVNYWPKQDQ